MQVWMELGEQMDFLLPRPWPLFVILPHAGEYGVLCLGK